jgi:uncharacterized protein
MTVEFIPSVEKLVQESMAHFDPSHDHLHVFRVRKMAMRLAAREPQIDLLVVELAALGHDLTDHKYNNDQSVIDAFSNLMVENGVSEDQRLTILKIIDNTSYSKEKRLKASGEWTQWHESCKELHW